MRWLVLTTFVLAFISVALTSDARAATGYDAAYFGESAFLTLAPGQSGQFAAAFTNTGSTGWQTGTASQVNLAVCSADKSTCNIASPSASWAVGWLSSTAYATQSTGYVGPGQTAWFVYSVRPPASTPTGVTTRFNGDLVLASTGELIHAVGYYQDAAVGAAALNATHLDLAPIYQGAQIGSFPYVTATVTADPASGTTTRQPVPNVVVMFSIAGSTTFNPPLTFTATTNANGQASVTYTRTNTGTDTLSVSLASMPSLQTSGSIVWTLTAPAITVTPIDNVSRANDVSGCRTYTYTANNPNTGQPLNGVTLYVNFIENINRPVDNDGGATIAGDTTGSPSPTSSIPDTTSATGTGSFTVCGNGSIATVTPFLFDNASSGNPQLFQSGDNAGAGGSITFVARVPVITLSPSTDAGRDTGDQRVYTISAVDQFGSAYAGPVRIGINEKMTGGSSGAYLTWVDNSAIPTTTQASGTTNPGASIHVPDTQNYLLSALNASGQATFGIYAPNPTTGHPIVWVDTNGNATLDSGESSAVGGGTTWAAATLSTCTLTRSKPLIAASGTSPNTAVLGPSSVFVVVTFRDQSGNPLPLTPAMPVTFQVSVSGANTIAARAQGQSADTLITSGTSVPLTTATAIGDTTAYVVLDAAFATQATISVALTAGTTSIACGPVTTRWVTAQPSPTSGTLQGTVTDFDKGQSSSDGGGYVLHTLSGDYVVVYTPGQPLIVTGTAVTEAGFESALSLGDVILWSYNSGASSHNIITNN